MKEYTSDKIRNVCLMGHGGSGKTTLAEAIMFNTGVLDRFGKVADGTTICDYDPEEIKRKISISTALAPCEWKDTKINLIDTPGYFDFVGEVKQGIRVADSALILVSGKSGVAVGTEKSWDYAQQQKIPVMFIVTKIDEENADFFGVLDKMKDVFGKSVIPIQLPIMENGKFTGYVDMIDLKAKKFEKDKLVDIPVPANLSDKVKEIKDLIAEAVAETDEDLMNKFFDGEDFTHDEILKGLKKGISDASITPVFCSSVINNLGIQYIMDSIVNYMPSPVDKEVIKAKNTNDQEIELKVDPASSLSVLVFKTIADPFVGKISMLRVYSGTLKTDSTVYNTGAEKAEKIGQLFVMRGKKHIPVDKLSAGDIGGVAKLQYTNTNDTLCESGKNIILDKIEFPEPAISMAVEPKSKGDEEKISSGLHKLQDEDPTFKVSLNTETHQTIISGIGEQHLDVIVSKSGKFNVSVDLTNPKIPYRETIRKKVKVEGKHKKQSGGHGQYGHVWIEFEHGDTEDLLFEEKIFGGAGAKAIFPAVEKAYERAIKRGSCRISCC
jgi:elongation factor G